MDYEKYIQSESEYKSIETLKGEFREFNPDKDQISMFKLIFILPNGECLLMPYDEHDKREGPHDRQYNHIAYIAKAIDLILKELNINKENFVRTKIEKFDTDELVAAILTLNISLFYEMGNIFSGEKPERYAIFMKQKKFTEKQEKMLLNLEKPLKREKYEISINILSSDEIHSKDKDIRYFYSSEKDPIKYICYQCKGIEAFDVDVFYEIINVSREPDL